MKNTKIVIVNKFRFTTFLSVVLLILTLLISSLLNVVIAKEDTYNDYFKVYVREGDTIWKIAQENNPYGEDIRKVVYEIEKMNKLEDEYIKPGDIIKVPRN